MKSSGLQSSSFELFFKEWPRSSLIFQVMKMTPARSHVSPEKRLPGATSHSGSTASTERSLSLPSTQPPAVTLTRIRHAAPSAASTFHVVERQVRELILHTPCENWVRTGKTRFVLAK